MAFFQFRRSREEQAAKLAPTQTVEAMRRRAMHRLIGAAVLVLAGVIGFPLVFDNQPRPIPVDLPIEIADKTKVKPLVVPAPAPVVASAASGIVVTQASDAEPATPVASPAPVVPAPPMPVTAALPSAPPAAPPTPVPAKVAAPPIDNPVAEKPVTEKSVAKSSEASKAQALLDGKPVASAPATEGRYVVQVGAFADADKVREVRKKVERVGLKTYTQVVATKDGSRIRIRVGPFPDKAQATQVAEKIKKLDISAVILTL